MKEAGKRLVKRPQRLTQNDACCQRTRSSMQGGAQPPLPLIPTLSWRNVSQRRPLREASCERLHPAHTVCGWAATHSFLIDFIVDKTNWCLNDFVLAPYFEIHKAILKVHHRIWWLRACIITLLLVCFFLICNLDLSPCLLRWQVIKYCVQNEIVKTSGLGEAAVPHDFIKRTATQSDNKFVKSS